MKKIVSFLVTAVMCAAIAFSAIGCATPPARVATSQVSLDVNPEIELVLDQNDKVLSVKCENEDARVLLYGETSLEGMDYQAAVEQIVELAIEYGYLDSENTVVNTRVLSGDEGVEAEILGAVNAKVVATADKLSLSVSTTDELPFSLKRAYDQYVAENPTAQISESDFAFAYEAAQEAGSDISAQIGATKAEIVKRVNDAIGDAEVYMDEAYAWAKAEAENAFDTAYSAAVDGIYATYYTTHRLGNLNTCYYGMAYQTYRTAATLLETGARLIKGANDYSNLVLSDSEVVTVYTVINSVNKDLLEISISDVSDGKGNVTLDTINAYVDKVYKNLPEEKKAEFAAAFTSVMNQLTAEIDAKIKSKAEVIIDDYKDALAQVKTDIDSVVGSNFMQGFSATFAEFDNIVNELVEYYETNGTVNYQVVMDAAGAMDDEASKIFAKIDADLSDNEKKEVENLRKGAETAINAARSVFNTAIDQAYTTATEYLAQLKAKIAE